MATSKLIVVQTKRFSVFEKAPDMKDALILKSTVAKGFGRGGKQLGCPTANLADDALTGEEETGVWIGWAKVMGAVYKCVASIGWNPFFKNEKKTCEPYIIHHFSSDFYGEAIEVSLCGYIRSEKNYSSLNDLVNAIRKDIEIAKAALDLPEFEKYKMM